MGKKTLQIGSLASKTELEAAIAKIGELQREKATLESDAASRINSIKEELSKSIELIDLEIQALSKRVYNYSNQNREVLFPAEKKTAELITGCVSYRKRKPSVKTRKSKKLVNNILEKHKLSSAVEKLEKRLSSVFLRLNLDLDKERALAYPKKAKEKAGLEFNEETERFYIKPSEVMN